MNLASADHTRRTEALIAAIRERRRRTPSRLVWRRIHGLADRQAPALRAAFLQAVAATVTRSSEEALGLAIAHRNAQGALAAIPWRSIGAPLLKQAAASKLRRVAREAINAHAGLRRLARLDDVTSEGAFSLVNPHAVAAAVAEAGSMITAVIEETQLGIAALIAQAIEQGIPPDQAARQIRDSIGLLDRQAATIAKLRAELEDAGYPEPEIERRIARKADELLNERAKTIAQTETLRAANAGQLALWKDDRSTGTLTETAQKEWIVTPDDRLCPLCEPLDGVRKGLDDVYSSGEFSVSAPPLHPNCRCAISLVTQ